MGLLELDGKIIFFGFFFDIKIKLKGVRIEE